MLRSDGHVYTVGKGNYIGQNYGRITNIRADAIDITELVEDAYGNWTFRQTELNIKWFRIGKKLGFKGLIL